jgi:TubC N-terminal docking domain
VNVVRLYHDLKKRDIRLEADDKDLKVDAPVGALTEEDRAVSRSSSPTS